MNLIEIRASDANDVTKKRCLVRALCLTSTAARTLARQRYLSFMPLPARIFGMHFSMRAVRVFDCFAPVKSWLSPLQVFIESALEEDGPQHLGLALPLVGPTNEGIDFRIPRTHRQSPN